MKKMMITGCLAGFLLGVSAGLFQGSSWSSILWRSSFAAVAAGFLLRWWGQIWINGLQQAHQEKLVAAEAAQQRAAQTKSK